MKRDPIRRQDVRVRRGVRVRVARRADRGAITALWALADRMHASLQPDYFRGDGRLDPRLLDALERASDRRELFVAERQGGVIGFVLVELLEQTRGEMRGRRGHIDTLVVAERIRRAGCGTMLVAAAAEWARVRRVEELLLTVWAGNESAERFYEALGLEPVSQVLRLTL